jgi:hypothetical protein
MIRMFCTGLTITTQRLLLVAFLIAAGVGSVEEFWRYFVTAAWIAWIVQLAIAEWWVARAAFSHQLSAVSDQRSAISNQLSAS